VAKIDIVSFSLTSKHKSGNIWRFTPANMWWKWR